MKMIKFNMMLFFILIITVNYVPGVENIQKPSFRKMIDFNQNWLFEKDDWVGLHNASQKDWNDFKWQKIRLPHSWNAEDTFDNQQGYYRGFGWYRKHFTIGSEHQGRRLFLRFGAIYVGAEIWVNDAYFGPYYSGYTPIEIDITDYIQWNEENLIAVRVNNIHNDDIPPGRWRMDYCCYGGIYREVELISLSPVYLIESDFFVTTPVVDEKQSEISAQITVKNETAIPAYAEVVCELFDGTNAIAKFAQSILVPSRLAVPFDVLKAQIKNIRLWSPDDPYLYTLHVTLFKAGEPVDDLVTQIGFRKFLFNTDNGFFLNGKPLKLRGLNRHQCYPGLANAVPPRLQIEDARLLKSLGANFVRCSHYPQHPEFLKTCDRLGLLVYEEVASWQHIGGDVFIANMNQLLEEMISRDRNHPSIILWGLMNEGRSVKMFERLQATAHRLDPTRPTCYAENHLDEAVQLGTAFIPDVIGLNYALDEYDEFHQTYPHVKLVNTECSNPDFSIYGDIENEIRGALKIKNDLNFIESRDYLAGACIWSMHDYGTEYKPVWPIQKSGVMDVYRRWKVSAYYLKSRWSTEPVVHIAGHWTYPAEEGEVKPVYVWSNCDRVKLFLNDKEIQTKSEAENVWHVSYAPGELKAIGRSGKREVQHVIKTAGKPHEIRLTPQSQQIFADGFDAVPVEAEVTDINGVIVPTNDVIVVFHISGPGKLIGIGGNEKVKTANGIAVILVQSTDEKGRIIVTAFAEGLTRGECQILTE